MADAAIGYLDLYVVRPGRSSLDLDRLEGFVGGIGAIG